MKKIKNIIKLSLLAVVVVTSSCSDFLDVNQDPNRVTDSNVTPELIFTQAENAIGTRQATRFVFMNNWMGYWARSGSFIVEQEETTYKVTSTFTENDWDQAYNILFDLYKVKTMALTANDSVLTGASIILSTKLWQEAVDEFGAIPYSQAFDHLKYPTPVYDPAATIYADLIVQLDKAISYLQTTPKPSFAKADIIFAKGDAELDVVPMWIKLANTIKLRIFLRQSAKGFVPSAAQIAKITTDGGFLGAGEDVSVNPGYSNQTDKQNPFYAAFGLTPSGAAASTNNKANFYYYALINDDRYASFYATPVTPTDYGALNGNSEPGGSQIVGTDIGPGLAGSSLQDQWILPSFESLFFQAEAITRGWISGNAQATYESAVTESFVWLGVPDAVNDATTSLADPTLGLNWAASAGTTTEDQLKFIAYQKYLSLNGIDPMEEWSDLRRGVLDLPLTYAGTSYLSWNAVRAPHLPWVLPYPQSEITTNGANVPARSGDQIFTEKLFWQP